MCFQTLDKYKDVGFAILRIGFGIIFIIHGYPKITGGPEFWGNIGQATDNLGIHFAPTFFGFMAAFSEFVGGICLVLGIFVRIASVFLLATMLVAASMLLSKGGGILKATEPIECAIVFLSFILIGAGKYSLANKLCPLKDKK